MSTLETLAAFLIFPSGLFVLLYGLAYDWIDRKVVARLQNRIGPRWFQPFADVLKLLSKEEVVPEGVDKALFLGLPIVALAGGLTAALYVPLFGIQPARSLPGDLIITLYLLSLLTLCTGLAGANTFTRFSVIGATRTLTQVFSYEAPFMLALLGPAVVAGSWQISDILAANQGYWMLLTQPIGFLVALSSTMAALKVLDERGETDSLHGRVAIGMLIVQDLAVVPLLILTIRKYNRKFKQIYTQSYEVESRITTAIQRSLSSIGLVQAFGREKDEYENFAATQSNSIRVKMGVHWDEVMYWFVLGTILAIERWRPVVHTQRIFSAALGYDFLWFVAEVFTNSGILLWYGQLLWSLYDAHLSSLRVDAIGELPILARFAIAALLSLTLGIGANAAIFQLLNAVRLRALPVARAEEIVEIRIDPQSAPDGRMGRFLGARPMMTWPLWDELRRRQQGLDAPFAWGTTTFDLAVGGESRFVPGLWASGELFAALAAGVGIYFLFTVLWELLPYLAVVLAPLAVAALVAGVGAWRQRQDKEQVGVRLLGILVFAGTLLTIAPAAGLLTAG